MKGDIVAIGGGGFTRPEDVFAIDRYLLELTGVERPKALFLPQASAEARDYVVSFFDAYTRLGAEPSWLSLYGRVEDGWEEQLLAADLIYVGGGNTRSMLALWKEWGVDRLLRQAAEGGTVLAGVSAGAICWFEQGITDSVWPLGVLECLGFLKGSCCPHYDGEAERRPAYREMLGGGNAEPGLALCDGAAVHYREGKLEQALIWRDEAAVYTLDREGEEGALEVRDLRA